jgi:hypothetical protein
MTAQKTEREEALEAARRVLGPIEPDGAYAVDGFFKDAAVVARALLSSAAAEGEMREAMREAMFSDFGCTSNNECLTPNACGCFATCLAALKEPS